MKKFILIVVMCSLLGGCAQKREISQLGVVSGFGIDKTETGYLLSAQIINPSSVAGNHQNTLPVYTIEAEGSTMFEAYRRLTNLSSKIIYLPHLNVIVINEALAKDGINSVLDFTLRNVQIRPNITLLVAKGVSASEILSTITPIESIPINQLNSISNMCMFCSGRQVNYNLYDVINMVNAKGANTVLNAVSLKTEDIKTGEKVENILELNSPTQFEINYLAAFREDKMVGFLNSQEAEYYNALMGAAKRFVITATVDEEYLITFESRNLKTDIKPEVDDKKVTVKCEVEGYLMEVGYPIDLSEPDNLKIVERYIEEELKGDLMALIIKSQQELKSDIFGVGGKIYKTDAKKWNQVEGYWDEIYPTLKFEVETKVTIKSVGDIQNLQK